MARNKLFFNQTLIVPDTGIDWTLSGLAAGAGRISDEFSLPTLSTGRSYRGAVSFVGQWEDALALGASIFDLWLLTKLDAESQAYPGFITGADAALTAGVERNFGAPIMSGIANSTTAEQLQVVTVDDIRVFGDTACFVLINRHASIALKAGGTFAAALYLYEVGTS